MISQVFCDAQNSSTCWCLMLAVFCCTQSLDATLLLLLLFVCCKEHLSSPASIYGGTRSHTSHVLEGGNIRTLPHITSRLPLKTRPFSSDTCLEKSSEITMLWAHFVKGAKNEITPRDKMYFCLDWENLFTSKVSHISSRDGQEFHFKYGAISEF